MPITLVIGGSTGSIRKRPTIGDIFARRPFGGNGNGGAVGGGP
jgi:hypothetical protein